LKPHLVASFVTGPSFNGADSALKKINQGQSGDALCHPKGHFYMQWRLTAASQRESKNVFFLKSAFNIGQPYPYKT
jgi:hypothetical protein